jgi:hypothetical protein
MKFQLFPWYQEIHIAYSSYKAFRSKIFQNLYIQSSSKNSISFRILKSNVGFLISFLFRRKMEIPESNKDYVGLVKNGVVLYFQLENNEVTWVWRKVDNSWKKDKFLGYQLISEYTVEEFALKYALIEKALKTHWDSVLIDSSNIHGDLTHFNILFNEKEELSFIDKKSSKHSKLFDFFYFYSYIRQCLKRCVTLSDIDEETVVKSLDSILKKVCTYHFESELLDDFNNLNFPEISGVNNETAFKSEFLKIFDFKD